MHRFPFLYHAYTMATRLLLLNNSGPSIDINKRQCRCSGFSICLSGVQTWFIHVTGALYMLNICFMLHCDWQVWCISCSVFMNVFVRAWRGENDLSRLDKHIYEHWTYELYQTYQSQCSIKHILSMYKAPVTGYNKLTWVIWVTKTNELVTDVITSLQLHLVQAYECKTTQYTSK